MWVNTKSKVYHYAGSNTYEHTKVGAYMCEIDTTAEATGLLKLTGIKGPVSASSSVGAGPPPAQLAGLSSHRRRVASWEMCSRQALEPA